MRFQNLLNRKSPLYALMWKCLLVLRASPFYTFCFFVLIPILLPIAWCYVTKPVPGYTDNDYVRPDFFPWGDDYTSLDFWATEGTSSWSCTDDRIGLIPKQHPAWDKLIDTLQLDPSCFERFDTVQDFQTRFSQNWYSNTTFNFGIEMVNSPNNNSVYNHNIASLSNNIDNTNLDDDDDDNKVGKINIDLLFNQYPSLKHAYNETFSFLESYTSKTSKSSESNSLLSNFFDIAQTSFINNKEVTEFVYTINELFTTNSTAAPKPQDKYSLQQNSEISDTLLSSDNTLSSSGNTLSSSGNTLSSSGNTLSSSGNTLVGGPNDHYQYSYIVHSPLAPTSTSLFDISSPTHNPPSRRYLHVHNWMHLCIHQLHGYWENLTELDREQGSLKLIGSPLQGYYEKNVYITEFVAGSVFILFLVIFVPIIFHISAHIVEEKETFVSPALRIFGTSMIALQTSWYLTMLGLLIFPIIISSSIFACWLWFHQNIPYVLITMILTLFAMLSLGTFLAAPFSNTKQTQMIVILIVLFLTIPGFFSVGTFPAVLLNIVSILSPIFHLGRAVYQFQYRAAYSVPLVFDDLWIIYHGTEPLGVAWIYLFCHAIGYYVLALYIQAIVPGEYQNPRPFYFFLLPSFWREVFPTQLPPSTSNNHGDYTPFLSDNSQVNEDSNNQFRRFFEPTSEEEKNHCAAILHNVHKDFGAFRAVDNVNLEFSYNSCYILLGHNGSGKTTLINMLTGIYPPSEGSITLYDKNHQKIESNGAIGFCPQQNSLYPKLTMREHLHLISVIKLSILNIEMTYEEVDEEINVLANRLKMGSNFDNKVDAIVETLSGGHKRKVCLAMALLHAHHSQRSPILVLDEPSSGCDISVQHDIWNIIREECTHGAFILLTTHNLDEATIADRLCIMVKGRVLCNGSAQFLKQLFGLGYNLTLDKQPHEFDRLDDNDGTNINALQDTTDEDNDVNNTKTKTFGGKQIGFLSTNSGKHILLTLESLVTSVVDSTCKKPYFSVHTDTQSSITLTLSPEIEQDLPHIFDIIEAHMAELNVTSISCSTTTLTDVFLYCNNGSMLDHDTTASHSINSTAPVTALSTQQSQPQQQQQQQQQIIADDIHALHVTNHVWDSQREHLHYGVLLLLQIFALYTKRFILLHRDWRATLKLLLVPIFCFILLAIFKNSHHVAPAQYPVYNSLLHNMPSAYAFLDGTFMPDATKQQLDEISEFNRLFSSNNKNWNAIGINMTEQTVFNTTDPLHPDLEDNVKAWQQVLNTTQNNLSYNNPMYLASYFSQLIPSEDNNDVIPNGQISFNTTSKYSSIMALNRFYQTYEEYTKYEHGHITITPGTQNVPNPFGNLITTSIFALLLAISLISLIPPVTHALVEERSNKIVHLQRISGMPILSYWIAQFLFDLTLAGICLGSTVLAAYMLGVQFGPTMHDLVIFYIFAVLALLPFNYVVSSLFKNSGSSQVMMYQILIFGPNVIMMAWTVCLTAFMFMFSHILPPTKLIIFPFFLVPSTWFYPPIVGVIIGAFSPDAAKYASISNWKWILPIIPGYWLLLFVIQYGQILHIFDNFNKQLPLLRQYNPHVDPSVHSTKQRIKEMTIYENDPTTPLISHGLRHLYGTFTAVNNLYFDVEKNSVFALMAPNSGGKSTTVSMLSGEILPSQSLEQEKHTAYLMGLDIVSKAQNCWRFVGVCPQQDTISLHLTARETLQFYSRLRGVIGATSEAFINDLLHSLGLAYAADRPAQTYSLGMRRRLSIGVALVGNPEIVILDEAATGVDPISRRNIQLLLKQTCKNRALILCSHMMDEVEALADNVGIMCHGQMVIVGSKTYLKQSIGDKYCVLLHIAPYNESLLAYYFINMLGCGQFDPHLEQKLKEHSIQTAQEAALNHTDENVDNNFTLGNANNVQIETNLALDPNFLLFAKNSGIDLYEHHHGLLVFHIEKRFFSLSQLFSTISLLQKNHSKLLLSFECSQLPLSQVFLEIVKKDDMAYHGF